MLTNCFPRGHVVGMKESVVERYFAAAVIGRGGRTYKFASPSQRGVADRIACLPNGTTWFVELKTKGGRVSELQRRFGLEMQRLNQNYVVLWDRPGVETWCCENIKG